MCHSFDLLWVSWRRQLDPVPGLFADVCSAATHIYSSQAWVNKTHIVKLSRLHWVKRNKYRREFFEYKLKKYYPLGRIVPGLTALCQTVLLWIWRAGMEGSETFHRQFSGADYYLLLFTMILHWYLSMHYKRLPPSPGKWWCQETEKIMELERRHRQGGRHQWHKATQQVSTRGAQISGPQPGLCFLPNSQPCTNKRLSTPSVKS